jgi:hypothetical protein
MTIDPSSCVHCGEPKEVDHHPIPKIRGGWFTIPLCGKCHGLAHHENKNMAQGRLTKEALDRKKALGEKTGGAVPYGFKMSDDGKTLVPDAREQEVLALIKRFREAGTTCIAIADHLNGRGIGRREGGRWNPQYIHRVCKRHGFAALSPVVHKKRKPYKPREGADKNGFYPWDRPPELRASKKSGVTIPVS